MTRKECECFRRSGGAGRLHRAFENRSRFRFSSLLTFDSCLALGMDAAGQNDFGSLSVKIPNRLAQLSGGCSCLDFFLDFRLRLRR